MASNYRPVSLTSIACKLLEHIVLSSIIDHFDRHRVLCDEQHGFRVKRSCESQLLITIDDITRNMEEGDQTDIILLDFAKAFDKVPPQSVILENHKSDPLDVVSGVPQGTVMGPLL